MFGCKAIIWDLDGTLIDTLEDLTDSVNHALRTGGHPEQELAVTRERIGHGVKNLIQRSLPEGAGEDEVQRTLAEFRSHYAGNLINKSHPYDGIIPALEEFKRQGIRMAVFSNKYHAAAVKVCDALLPGLMDAVLGEQPGIARKPSPEGAFKVLEQLGVRPEDAVYVGDGDTDAEAAVNAGIRFVGVTWGFRTQEDLSKKGARVFAHVPQQLTELIGRK